MKSQILVGASAICWVLWLTRNDFVFNKTLEPFYFRKEEDHHLIKMGCRTIETDAMEVFVRHSWRFSNRIAI